MIKLTPKTALLQAGNNPNDTDGVINPPVCHASTLKMPTLAEYRKVEKGVRNYQYGLIKTPTSNAFTTAIATLENAYQAFCVPSGLVNIAATFWAFIQTGDHILISDTVYAPTRFLANKWAQKLDLDVEYFDPAIGANIVNLCKSNTRFIFMESPGSFTFEMMDIPAIVKVAKTRNIITIIDNTWSAGFYFKPLDHGVDISLQAATKYISGHSDLCLGTIACNKRAAPLMEQAVKELGIGTGGPDDIYLALRGLKTLSIRLAQHYKSALEIAHYLETKSIVKKVIYPALPQDSGYALWKRDFTGATSLFGFVMEDRGEKALAHMLDPMNVFMMGSSWGGYSSLLIPTNPNPFRTVKPWTQEGQLMRIYIGLEDTGDLCHDLEEGFKRYESL